MLREEEEEEEAAAEEAVERLLATVTPVPDPAVDPATATPAPDPAADPATVSRKFRSQVVGAGRDLARCTAGPGQEGCDCEIVICPLRLFVAVVSLVS